MVVYACISVIRSFALESVVVWLANYEYKTWRSLVANVIFWERTVGLLLF